MGSVAGAGGARDKKSSIWRAEALILLVVRLISPTESRGLVAVQFLSSVVTGVPSSSIKSNENYIHFPKIMNSK